MKSLIVTADDYAMSEAIDAGIVDLIAQGRVSATSCMTLSPRWPQAAALLTTAVRQCAHLGLHLDLTEFAAPRWPLGRLILTAYAGGLDKAALRQTLSDQLDRFESALGQAPHYVDGHQHVHQLPQVRRVLVDVLMQRYAPGRRPWLRISDAGVAQGWKGVMIARLGSGALRRLARRHGLLTTDRLLGVYDFQGDADQYLQRLRRWLPHVAGPAQGHEPGGTALMCHPAAHLDPADPLGAARHAEYLALRSEGFAALLAKAHLRVVPGPA